MADFTTKIYIYTESDEEHEIPVVVDYDATYDPGRLSGPWENCYPPSGEMIINSIEPVEEWPEGITLNMVSDRQLAKIEDEAWEHYHSRGVDDEN